MVDFLRSWILNITVIIVFVMLLETVMPNGAMKRYINVVIGLLIIIVVTKPFILLKDYAKAFDREVAVAASYIEADAIADKSDDFSRYQKLKAMEIYENSIKNQILKVIEYISPESSGKARVKLDIDKEYESKDFGQIKHINVSIKKSSTAVIEVNKIKIGGQYGTNENKNVINEDKGEYNLNDRQLCSEIENGISRILGISEANITVEVQQ